MATRSPPRPRGWYASFLWSRGSRSPVWQLSVKQAHPGCFPMSLSVASTNSVKLVIPLHFISWKKTPNDAVTPQRQSQFTAKMKANAVPRLLSSLVWIDQYNECNGMTSFMEFMSLGHHIHLWHKTERKIFHKDDFRTNNFERLSTEGQQEKQFPLHYVTSPWSLSYKGKNQ